MKTLIIKRMFILLFTYVMKNKASLGPYSRTTQSAWYPCGRASRQCPSHSRNLAKSPPGSGLIGAHVRPAAALGVPLGIGVPAPVSFLSGRASQDNVAVAVGRPAGIQRRDAWSIHKHWRSNGYYDRLCENFSGSLIGRNFRSVKTLMFTSVIRNVHDFHPLKSWILT